MDRLLVVLTITLGIVLGVHLAGGFGMPLPEPAPARYGLRTSISPLDSGSMSPSDREDS